MAPTSADWRDSWSPIAYRGTSASSSTATDAGRRPPAHQPRAGIEPAPTRSTNCSAGAKKSVSSTSRCGCCPPTTSLAPPPSFAALMTIIENTVQRLGDSRRWRIHPVGALDLLPAETARVLKEVGTDTAGVDGMTVNIAVGYGGDARSPTPYDPAPRPRRTRDIHRGAGRDPRRGTHCRPSLHPRSARSRSGHPYLGEQRLGGFLLWQSAHRSSTSARRTGLTSVASTSCAPCAPTPNGIAATAPEVTVPARQIPGGARCRDPSRLPGISTHDR